MKGIAVQVFSAFVISLGNFFTGCAVTWSSYTLETLEGDNSPLGTKVTKNEGALIGSLPMLGSFVITVFTGWLADTIGRKRTTLLGGLCFVLSWSIIASANNVPQIIAGRFIMGLAMGIHIVVSINFVNELSQMSIRGTLASCIVSAYAFGTLVSYVTGWLCSYDVINYFNLTLCVIFVVLLSFLKETPAFLLLKGRDKDAIKSLKFYRGVSSTTQEILDEITDLRNQRHPVNTKSYLADLENPNLSAEKEKLRREKNYVKETSAWEFLLSSKSSQRALVIVTLHVLLLVFGGTIAVQAYAGRLFGIAAPELSSHMCAVILAIAFAVGSALSTGACDLVGRRTLMITSSVLSSVCLAVLASLLRWSWAPEWTIPAAVLAYCCSFQMGVANVPFVQLSESFVPKLKSQATMLAVSVMCVGNFIVLAVFGPAVDCLGLDGTFFMFSIICAITTVTAFLFMKETKGEPLDAIQEMYAEGFLYRKKQTVCTTD